MRIKVIKKSKHQLSEHSTKEAVGMDLRANLKIDLILKPLERILVPPVLFLEIPVGHEAQIRPGNVVASRKGVTVLNTPGTIGGDYRCEVCLILVNLSNEKFVVKDGEHICQMIINKQERSEWESVNILLDSDR
jgi:dUTP pyrophosphatase